MSFFPECQGGLHPLAVGKTASCGYHPPPAVGGRWSPLTDVACSAICCAVSAALLDPNPIVRVHCYGLLRRVEKHTSATVRLYFSNLNYYIGVAYNRYDALVCARKTAVRGWCVL